MISIDQLLESVDLDLEPRFVTKNENGTVCVWEQKPEQIKSLWYTDGKYGLYSHLKLSEFDGKPWQECIYEVPRKTDEHEQNLEKLRPADSDLVYRVKLPRKTTGKIERLEPLNGLQHNWLDKINELVDAVNELKGKMNVV